MRTAKLSWVLFVLALGLVGCTKAEDKKKAPEIESFYVSSGCYEPGKEEKAVYEGKTVEQWIEDLKHSNPIVRVSASKALKKIGPESVPALIKALNYKDSEVRRMAALILGSFGQKAEKVVPALIKVLKDKDEDVRKWAAISLGKIGPKAEKAVPALIEALKDKDEDVRIIAVDSLGEIGPKAKEAIPALTETLKDKNEKIRIAAQTALKKIQKK